MKQHLSSAEQETILSIDNETKRWNIYTTRSQDINKYSKLIAQPEITKYDDGQVMSVEGDLKDGWYLPKFREHKTRVMTDEQRAELVERGKRLARINSESRV